MKSLASFLIKVGAKFGPNVNVNSLLPHPTTISRNISTLYDTHFEIVKAQIINCKRFGYSITSDLGTDNYLRTSFLSCTMHYIHEGLLINRLLAIKSMDGETCTGKDDTFYFK